MRILVFSDSHGSTYRMREAISLHTEADIIIHLGDGERDIDLLKEEIGNRKVVQVCGNCDIYSLDVNKLQVVLESKNVAIHFDDKLIPKVEATDVDANDGHM